MRHLSDFKKLSPYNCQCIVCKKNDSDASMACLPNLHLSNLHIQPAHGARVGLCSLKKTQNTVTAASCKFFFLAYEKIVEFTISSIAFKRFRNGTAKFFTEKIFTLFLSHALIVNADCIKEIGKPLQHLCIQGLPKLTPKFCLFQKTVNIYNIEL